MAWYRRLLNVGRTGRLNAEIERELVSHVEERAQALRAAGLSEEEALREARRRLGNATLQRERTRDADVVVWVDSLVRDVRHALRGLVRSPVFAGVAIVSLALGIGANTAIFSLIDALVLRPLAVPAPEELVVIGTVKRPEAWFTNPLWEQIRDRQSGLSAVAAYSEALFNTADGGEPRRVFGAYVSNEIGVRIALGADRSRVLRLVMTDVVRVLVLGLAVGAAGALAAGRLVESFLYGVSAAEPMVLAAGATLLALVAVCAGAVPAWRAARMDPASAVRND